MATPRSLYPERRQLPFSQRGSHRYRATPRADAIARYCPCSLGINICTPLQLGHTGAGAVFVLLRRSAAHAAGAFDDAVADDRDGSLTHDHVAARGAGNAAGGRLIRALAHFAAGPAERRRGDGLALAAISTCPDRIVHPLQRHQTAAAVAHCGADPDVELLGFCYGAANDAVCFI